MNIEKFATEKEPELPHSDSSSIGSSHVDDKQLLRKLDYKLLPPLTLLYLLSFLDRSNGCAFIDESEVGNARLEGLTADLHMTGDQYLTGLTLYFVGYVLFEVPCNIILKRTSPQSWLPTLTLVWGIIATLMGVTQAYPGFLVVRFFLGVAESGLFPGVVFYLSMWYKRNEQHYRISLFFSAASLAGAFGGILAFGIAKMKGVGGYNGWRWIFIIEGLVTVVVSVAAYFFVYNYPATAGFLSEEERARIHQRLKDDSDASQDEAFTWSNVLKATSDPKPTIITSLGYSAAQAQLLTVPPYAFGFILTLTFAVLSERFRMRAPFILAGSSLAILGYILLLSDPRPGISYLGTVFAAGGIYPATAIVLSWPANNVSGQTKRATANALQISIGNLGAVLGTQLYRTESRPRYFLGHGFALGYLVCNLIVVTTLRLVLARANAQKSKAERDARISDSEEWLGDEDPRWIFQL
ncbi:MAG: hypothetical protein Q9160_005714 [Pyrenula sp. 1 TL-2023]